MDLITERLTMAKFLADIGPENESWGANLRATFQDDADLEGIEFIRKGIELTELDLQLVPGERADIATISTLALDRDQEVLLPEGADLRFYRDNPIVPYAHNYYDLPIGTSEWVKIDSRLAPTKLIAKTRYASAEANPKAQQVFLLIQEGILRAKSVGFIPISYKTPNDDDWVAAVTKWRQRREIMLRRKSREGDPRRIYTKWILLEQSPVPVPSNPEALGLAVSKGILTMEEAKESGLVVEPVVVSKREAVEDSQEETPEPEEAISDAESLDAEVVFNNELVETDYVRLHPDDRALIEELQELLKQPAGLDIELLTEAFHKLLKRPETDPKSVDVMTREATGDGVTDDTDAIQDAIIDSNEQDSKTDDLSDLDETDIKELIAAALLEPKSIDTVKVEKTDDTLLPEMTEAKIKELVAAALVEPEDDEPSPQTRTMLKQGELI